MCWDVIIQHESFDPVPFGEDPPYLENKISEWRAYSFCTEEELNARRSAPYPEDVEDYTPMYKAAEPDHLLKTGD